MKSQQWSSSQRNGRRSSISWLSVSKSLLFYLMICQSIIHGQLVGEDDYGIDDAGFIPTFGPHGGAVGSSGSFKRAIGSGSRALGFASGDIQSNFLDLFDWNKEMPVTDIVNTFLENEQELPILQELSQSCSRSEFFYGTNPRHMSAVMTIKNMLMEQKDARDVIMMAGSLRDKAEVNPNAWLRAVVAASMNRPDMAGLRKPAMIEVMPSMLVPGEAIQEMKRQARLSPQSRTCVRVDGNVGADNGAENALFYWREDVMVNSHHWYWHLSYPTMGGGPRQDRRGELFHFMHHNFLARYHAERLAHGLAPIIPLNIQRGSILREPYSPHLFDTNAMRFWSPRPANVPVSDVMSGAIPGIPPYISLDNRTLWLDRILEGIASGSLLDTSGREVSILDSRGVDLLGDVVESDEFSINPNYYGVQGFHNAGHVLISLVLDPFARTGTPPGVMGDPGTAMRDVIFYPYHLFVDDIFEAHKRTLPPYTLKGGEWPLVWDGVEVASVNVQAHGLPVNSLQTFWGEKQYDLARGLDFNRTRVQGAIRTCVRHLDHQDFEYEIIINRKDYVKNSKASVRIFMAPRFNHKGQRYTLAEQRKKFFILDKFSVSLNVGRNVIRRRSDDTHLTIDFPQSHLELNTDLDSLTPFCGCGWPHHLLLPKGTPDGMIFDLFVMVTNGREDAVRQTGRQRVCRAAPIFCGIEGELYPDARPMGYPFDRPIYTSHNINPLDPAFDEVDGPISLEEWILEIPNSAVNKVVVTHVDEIRNPVAVYDAGEPGGNFIGPGIGPGLGGPGEALVDNGAGGIGDLGIQENFGPSPGIKHLAEGTDFFNEFFPSTRPARNHPKEFAPEIEPPPKEFIDFLGKK